MGGLSALSPSDVAATGWAQLLAFVAVWVLMEWLLTWFNRISVKLCRPRRGGFACARLLTGHWHAGQACWLLASRWP